MLDVLLLSLFDMVILLLRCVMTDDIYLCFREELEQVCKEPRRISNLSIYIFYKEKPH
jgi:hypothetical protein